jgi:hypothetical protein
MAILGMNRRTFFAALGGATMWSLAAGAQKSAMPVGFCIPLR